MANQSKLKAWVRYDGTGRVISGGPIFQVNKPKVGNWKQIDANLCCNGTTGTTTTQGGGGTPTAFIQSYFLNTYNACNSTYDGSLLFYSASTTIQSGITVFTDAALTIPVTAGYVISTSPQPMQFVKYVVGTGGVLTEIYCQSSFYFGTTAEIACSQSSPAQLLSVAMNTSSIYNGSIVYANFASVGFSIGQTIYMRFSPGFAATVPVQVTSATTGTVTGTETECPSPVNQESAIGAFSAGNACAGMGAPLTLFYSGSLGNGTALFYDAGLTQPYTPGSLPSGNGTYLRIYFNAEEQVCRMNGNIVTSAGPCSTTPTIDFTVASFCSGNASLDPSAIANNFSGTSTGNVYASGPQFTQQDALNNIYTGQQFNNSFPASYGQQGGYTVGQTYWMAVQDTNNAANVLAKSFVVTSCN